MVFLPFDWVNMKRFNCAGLFAKTSLFAFDIRVEGYASAQGELRIVLLDGFVAFERLVVFLLSIENDSFL